jgi:hypothetical protein
MNPILHRFASAINPRQPIATADQCRGDAKLTDGGAEPTSCLSAAVLTNSRPNLGTLFRLPRPPLDETGPTWASFFSVSLIHSAMCSARSSTVR